MQGERSAEAGVYTGYMRISSTAQPTDNPYIESFNGKLRDECLSVNWFLDMGGQAEILYFWLIQLTVYTQNTESSLNLVLQ